jgi:hypothetical protein
MIIYTHRLLVELGVALWHIAVRISGIITNGEVAGPTRSMVSLKANYKESRYSSDIQINPFFIIKPLCIAWASLFSLSLCSPMTDIGGDKLLK